VNVPSDPAADDVRRGLDIVARYLIRLAERLEETADDASWIESFRQPVMRTGRVEEEWCWMKDRLHRAGHQLKILAWETDRVQTGWHRADLLSRVRAVVSGVAPLLHRIDAVR
jgi:hypothetical protein